MQHDHCSYCGALWPAGLGWPRTCAACGETTWSNPLPVAVVLLPVQYRDGREGVVVVRRNIEPYRGELALPGGFIETGESWREAAARELDEETGFSVDPDAIRLFDVHSSTGGYSLMVFCLAPPVAGDQLPPSTPNEETMEWLVLTEPAPLCFPTHTRAMADYFAGQPAISH
jgi:ADP-ribose pyrophosphatase YjhB (NUDIX family)